MAQRPLELTGPYRVDVDGVRVPDIPSTVTRWEQSTDELDVRSVLGAPKRFVIVALEYNASHVSSWAAKRGNAAAPLDKSIGDQRAKLQRSKASIAEKRAALAYYQSRIAKSARATAIRRKALDVAPAILPFLAYPLVEALGKVGMSPEEFQALITPGTILIADAWSGADNSDVHGRTPDTTDPGGTFSTKIGANGIEINSSTVMARNDGASAASPDAFADLGISETDQFSEAIKAERNHGHVAVRIGNYAGGIDCYAARVNAGAIRRVLAGVLTTLSSGSSNSGNYSIRLEAVGTALSCYLDTSEAFPTGSATLWTSAVDASIASGAPGGYYSNTGSRWVDSWRGGSIGGGGGGGGGGGVDGMSLRSGHSSLFMRLRRGWGGR